MEHRHTHPTLQLGAVLNARSCSGAVATHVAPDIQIRAKSYELGDCGGMAVASGAQERGSATLSSKTANVGVVTVSVHGGATCDCPCLAMRVGIRAPADELGDRGSIAVARNELEGSIAILQPRALACRRVETSAHTPPAGAHIARRMDVRPESNELDDHGGVASCSGIDERSPAILQTVATTALSRTQTHIAAASESALCPSLRWPCQAARARRRYRCGR
jgi:hypothetical protein